MESNGSKYISIKIDKRMLFIIVAIIIAILTVGGIVHINSPSHKIEKYLSLGEKYLSELKYEDAVMAFDKVLEIDAKNIKAIEREEEAYSAWAQSEVDNGEYDKAIDVLNAGYIKLKSSTIREKMTPTYLMWADSLCVVGDFDRAVSVLENGAKSVSDKRLTDRKLEIQTEIDNIKAEEQAKRDQEEKEERIRKYQEERDKHYEDEFKAIYSEYIETIRKQSDYIDLVIRNILLFDAGNDGLFELYVFWEGNNDSIEEVYSIQQNEVVRIFSSELDEFDLWISEDEEGNSIVRIIDKEGSYFLIDGKQTILLFRPLPDGVNETYQYLVKDEYIRIVPTIYERAQESKSSEYEDMYYITEDEMQTIWEEMNRGKKQIEVYRVGLYISYDMTDDKVYEMWDKAWKLAWHCWYGDVDKDELEEMENSATQAEQQALDARKRRIEAERNRKKMTQSVLIQTAPVKQADSNDGSVCAVCGSTNIKVVDYDNYDDYTENWYRCQSCGHSWRGKVPRQKQENNNTAPRGLVAF